MAGPPWDYHQIGVVVPLRQARAWFARARCDARFRVSESAIGVVAPWAGRAAMGRLCVWWERPTATQAVVWQVGWARGTPDACSALLRALSCLVGDAGAPLLAAIGAQIRSEPPGRPLARTVPGPRPSIAGAEARPQRVP